MHTIASPLAPVGRGEAHPLRPEPTPMRSGVGRAVRALVAAVLVLGAVVLADPGTGRAATTWFVAVGGDDAGAGSDAEPLATINAAVRRATSGDTIRVGPGRYHESVQVYEKTLHLVGDGPDRTVLDGAAPVVGFVADADGRFSAPWSTRFERSSELHTLPDRAHAGWPEQFFLDGRQLREVPSRDEVVPGAFYHDVAGGRVVLGDDPGGRLVEGSALGWGIYLNRAHGSTVTGLGVDRFATEERHMAAIRAYGDDLRLVDVGVRDNARIGLSIMGNRVEVRRVAAHDNGYLGLHAHRSAGLVVTDSTVVGNNREEFDAWHAAGGVKVTNTGGFEFRRNVVNANLGPGLWTDLDVRGAVVSDSYFRDNLRSGVEIELSTDVVVVDNVTTGNGEQGVWVLESQRVDVWHNYSAGNEHAVWVLDGPRGDVFDVTIGNNVFADPTSARTLVAVDDWTEARTASDMRVRLDGNRYWTSGSGTGLVRWSNWPAPLTIADDLATVQAATGQEPLGVVATSATNPFTTAQLPLVPVPDHVEAVRSARATASGAEDGGEAGVAPDEGGGADGAPVAAIDGGGLVAIATIGPDASPVRLDAGGGDGLATTAPDTTPEPPVDPPATPRAAAPDRAPIPAAGEDDATPVPAPTPGWRSFGDHLRAALATGG